MTQPRMRWIIHGPAFWRSLMLAGARPVVPESSRLLDYQGRSKGNKLIGCLPLPNRRDQQWQACLEFSLFPILPLRHTACWECGALVFPHLAACLSLLCAAQKNQAEESAAVRAGILRSFASTPGALELLAPPAMPPRKDCDLKLWFGLCSHSRRCRHSGLQPHSALHCASGPFGCGVRGTDQFGF